MNDQEIKKEFSNKRVLKFRAWHNVQKEMLSDIHDGMMIQMNSGEVGTYDEDWHVEDVVLMQFTGLKDKNGKDIYEGDIFRIEENATEVDEVDRVFYVVIVWVKEWCMFCSLLVESEYFDYTDGGINALDEPMFWTYTLEDTNSRKHFLCGNIFETPELLQNL